ncbi:hypothetical protein OEA41_003414 [Lepraria neglecta]|uniref:3-hydroxyisobutyrate dehydrogenase n=1 Tax=Lepraria neglecta TaxID=209136 RepID=A0AAD9Z4M1_9LECA|nr:hypothetical protein OEA41_003414 [Lepraria neglecta]
MTSAKPKLVFAGLGAMGYGMASHLLKSGFSVIGYDVYQPAMERLVAEGGQSASTPREAAMGVEFFVCMVANSLQATPLLFHPDTGAVEALPKNASILMCSTVAPAYIDEVKRCLHEIGRSDIRLIDSPVSGGTARAANGTLSIFSSGEENYLSNAHTILQCLSGKLYKVPGGLGGGSKAKLIHQIFAGVNIAMASEAMGLTAAAGLNTQETFDELKYGEGESWMFNNRVPHMLDPTLPPYSAITIIAKDVGIITSTARDFKFPLPMISTAEQLYLTAISAGWGKEDDCVMTRLYLPGRPELVMQRAKAIDDTRSTDLTVDDIKDLMGGVHLAAMAEAMSFCEHLGIDTNLMYDIVSNAAGASAIFLKTFADMQKGNWKLRSVASVEEIRDRLVSIISLMSEAIGY